MRVLFICAVAATLASPLTAPSAEPASSEIQHFLDRGWGFECRRSEEGQTVCAVRARDVGEARAQEFLGSLRALERLTIEDTRFGPGDIRSLARRCPSLSAIHVTGEPFDLRGRFLPESQPLKAAIWPEFFELGRLKHLSVDNLYCSGADDWVVPDRTELETLELSGNLSGMLSSLLALCRVRSLQIEFCGDTQKLTANDHKALNKHGEIESLAIYGNPFGGDILLHLNALSDLTKLRQLTLEQCTIDPESLQRFPLLHTLSLQRCAFVRHDFDALLAHPTLEQLVLWETRNEDLRIGDLPATPPRKLRSITIRSPLFPEIDAFAGLPCSYNVELFPSICYMADRDSRGLRRLGTAEVATLEKLRDLHSVSISGFASQVDAAALRRLAHIETLRCLEVDGVTVAQETSPETFKLDSRLEEVRLVTERLLNQDLAARFLGRNTHAVFLGDYSYRNSSTSPSVPVISVHARRLGLFGISFPVAEDSLYGQLLSPSVEDLTLELCHLNKGAIEQVVRQTPSLRRLTLDGCSSEDVEEFLRLNELADLEWVSFADTDVSAETALAMKAKHIRFGNWED